MNKIVNMDFDIALKQMRKVYVHTCSLVYFKSNTHSKSVTFMHPPKPLKDLTEVGPPYWYFVCDPMQPVRHTDDQG